MRDHCDKRKIILLRADAGLECCAFGGYEFFDVTSALFEEDEAIELSAASGTRILSRREALPLTRKGRWNRFARTPEFVFCYFVSLPWVVPNGFSWRYHAFWLHRYHGLCGRTGSEKDLLATKICARLVDRDFETHGTWSPSY